MNHLENFINLWWGVAEWGFSVAVLLIRENGGVEAILLRAKERNDGTEVCICTGGLQCLQIQG